MFSWSFPSGHLAAVGLSREILSSFLSGPLIARCFTPVGAPETSCVNHLAHKKLAHAHSQTTVAMVAVKASVENRTQTIVAY